MLVLLIAAIGLAGCQPNAAGNTTASPDARLAEDRNIAQGRLWQALYHLEALAAQQGWSASDHIRAGEIYQSLGRAADAVPHWQAAIQAAPNTPIMQPLIESLIGLQRWPEAADTLRQRLVFAPEDTWAHYQIAILIAASNPLEASDHLAAASATEVYTARATALSVLLSAEASDPVRALNVGVWMMEQQLFGHAELAFRYAADVGYPFAEASAYVGLARAYQSKPGLSWIDQAVALNPMNPRVLTIKGLYLRAQGDTGASLNAFAQASGLDPFNPALMVELATAYQQVGDLPQAEYWFKSAAALNDSGSEYDRLLAQFYAGLAAPFATTVP